MFPHMVPWKDAWRRDHAMRGPTQVFVRRCGRTRRTCFIPRGDTGRRDYRLARLARLDWLGVMAIMVRCTHDGRRKCWAELPD